VFLFVSSKIEREQLICDRNFGRRATLPDNTCYGLDVVMQCVSAGGIAEMRGKCGLCLQRGVPNLVNSRVEYWTGILLFGCPGSRERKKILPAAMLIVESEKKY
jgi:hypothetical protein